MELSGCMMGASATFGCVYVKINEAEMLVIMRLNIAAATIRIMKNVRLSSISIAHSATVTSTTTLGLNLDIS